MASFRITATLILLCMISFCHVDGKPRKESGGNNGGDSTCPPGDSTCSGVGQCPPTDGLVGTCVEECSSDTECEDGFLCCSNGCGHACVVPLGNENPSTPFMDTTGEFEFNEDSTDYGRKGIRIMRMRKEGDIYFIKEFTVDVKLKLSTHDEYMYGNNAQVMPTDTIQNRVYALAKEEGFETPEQFGINVCDTFLDEYPQVNQCKTYIEERPWRRMDNQGMEHNHAFVTSQEGIRFAEIKHNRDESHKVYGGIKDLQLIKTTMFQFLGFYKDAYTSLPETDKWILSTNLWITWLYGNETDYDETWSNVKNVTMTVFSGPPDTGVVADSIHRVGYQIVEAILDKMPQISEAAIEIPLFPYFLADLAKIGIQNDFEVFAPVDSPHGFARAALKRADMQQDN